MTAHDVRSDRQAQPHTAAPVLVAGLVQSGEGLQRLFPLVARDAGTIVLDGKANGPFKDRHGKVGPPAVAQRVADQVVERTPERRAA